VIAAPPWVPGFPRHQHHLPGTTSTTATTANAAQLKPTNVAPQKQAARIAGQANQRAQPQIHIPMQRKKRVGNRKTYKKVFKVKN